MKPSSTLADLLEEMTCLANNGPPSLLDQQSCRKQMLECLRRLTFALQTPQEAVRNNAFSPVYNTCVRVAIDLDIFKIITTGGERSASDLALTTESSQELIWRLLRVLTGIGFVEEIDECCYGANATTRLMSQPAVAASIIHFFDQSLPSLACLPRYFQTYGYQSPNDYLKGPFQFAHGTDLETYEYWVSQEHIIKNFDTFMNGGKLGNQQKWLSYFPAQEIIIDGYQEENATAILVDVAGGRGHDLEAFLQMYPHVPGTLVLEDLPETITLITNLDERIERIGYNFFEKQPVTGARAYFLQSILHNWPTSVCRLVLRNLVAAMRPGYSKLLISELVLPDENCPLPMAGLDFSMMSMHSGMERSERQWRDLLATEGLKIVKVWHSPDGDGGIVEAMIDEPTLWETHPQDLNNISSFSGEDTLE